jgi:hypothetical protein
MANNNAEALIAAPLATAGALIAATVRRHPVRSAASLGAYLVGLGCALFFSGLATSAEQMARFERLRPSTDAAQRLFDAQRAAAQAQGSYRQAQGWFWSCDAYCQSLRRTYESQARDVARLQDAYDAQMRAAKGELGVFSAYGVAEARELFASLYGWGKGMAGRMSFYDVLFTGFRMSRDDTFVEVAARLVTRVLTNIFVSGCAVVVSFATGVTSVIYSFAPSWPEAVAFWVLSMLAVLAVALTACVGCCCCVVGVPVAVAQLAPPGTFRMRRIDAGGNLRDFGGNGRPQPGFAFGGGPGYGGGAGFRRHQD